MINISDLEASITDKTILISIMHSNNEVGTIQAIKEISKITHKHEIILHTDASQSIGKSIIDVKELDIDLLTIAGHKLYAPKGIGALYIRNNLILEKIIHGANHENDRRAGTENVLGIIGLGKACEIIKNNIDKHIRHLKELKDFLYSGLNDKLADIKINGHPQHCLPNTLSLSILGIESNVLLSEIEKFVSTSGGSACHSGNSKISGVLQAMNIPIEWAKGTIRLSVGRMTTEEEIERAIELIYKAVIKIRK